MRILVVVEGGLGPRVSGPEIRGWELARALGHRHAVTVAVHDPPSPEREGLRLVPSTRGRLAREARRHDAVVAPILAPYLFAAVRGAGTMMVSDQYDPVELELSSHEDQSGLARVLEAQRSIRRMQLRFSDVIACAAERQRELLERELAALGARRGPAPTVVTVPFGLTASPQQAPAGALRRRFAAIGPDDPLVLWWGKVWRWFDAATALRAFAVVVRSRPDARLVISAGKAPKAAFDRSESTGEARALARRLGLLDRNVFFLDEWVPYGERHALLQDADLGLTLHAETAEAPFAARARYMDYLWASLPCVLAHGDEVAARFGRAGFARLVTAGDVDGAARAMLALIEDGGAIDDARAAGRALADDYRWTSVVAPLAQAIEERAGDTRPPGAGRAALAREVGGFYARRAADHAALLGRSASRRPAARKPACATGVGL